MATKTQTAPETETEEVAGEEWETVQTGLGLEWDLEREGPIVGRFTEMKTLPVADKQNGGMRDTNAYLIDVNGDPRFIWGSYETDLAFNTGGTDGGPIDVGTKVRIQYLGQSQFSNDQGQPRTVKNYKVQIAKSK